MAVEKIATDLDGTETHRFTGRDVEDPQIQKMYDAATEQDKELRVQGDHPGHKPLRGTLLFQGMVDGRWATNGWTTDGRIVYVNPPPNCEYEKVEGGYAVLS